MNLSSRRLAEAGDPLMVFDTSFSDHRFAVAVVESPEGLRGVGPDGQRSLALLARHVSQNHAGGTSHVVPVSQSDSPRRRVLQVLRLLTGGPIVEPWARTSSITFVCQGVACYRQVVETLDKSLRNDLPVGPRTPMQV